MSNTNKGFIFQRGEIMKFINYLRKFLLVLSVMLCLYAQLIIVDGIICGSFPAYHIPVMCVVFTWLSLMFYANYIYER